MLVVVVVVMMKVVLVRHDKESEDDDDEGENARVDGEKRGACNDEGNEAAWIAAPATDSAAASAAWCRLVLAGEVEGGRGREEKG